ncbi:MAG: hypothetical protein HZB39_12595 [Planctomycetes bacterium]|nr:hypothetical protein [Planctomycetota bacterium]
MDRATDPPRDELLRALVVGDRRADEPAIAARLANDAELAAAWREYLALTAALDSAGKLRAAVLDDTSVASADESQILAAFRSITTRTNAASGTADRRRDPARRTLLAAAGLLLGATLVLGGLWAWFASRDGKVDDSRTPRHLAGGSLSLVADTPFGELRWSLVGDDQDAVVIDVRAFALAGDGTRGALLIERRDVRESGLTIEPALYAGHTVLEFEIELRRAEGGAPSIDVIRQSR